MSRYGSASKPPPITGGGLPRKYAPVVAGYAKGPFIEPDLVTPTDWRWRNARTFIVRDKTDGRKYRTLRVTDGEGGRFIGYWAVELLGTPLTLGAEYDPEEAEALARYEAKRKEADDGREAAG